VASIPDNGNHGTWSWDSIEAYLDSGSSRPLEDLLEEILLVLRSRVWLPDDADYYVLALAAVTSYVQEIFDAVPLILVAGPMDTGKSELSAAMAKLGANGVLIAQSTMATISRTIDECRGLVALDDLESIGTTGGTAQFTELRQNLKLSYKKSTGQRRVTEGTTGIDLRFYGVKIINNTSRTDPILGSRMLEINTAAMPAGTILPTTLIETARLRDDLHTWAFSNVAAIASAYASFPLASRREEEITLPLRVLIQLSGNRAFYEAKLASYLSPASAPSLSAFDKELQTLMDKKVADGDEFFITGQVSAELQSIFTSKRLTWPVKMTNGLLGKRLRDLGYVARGKKAKLTRLGTKVIHEHLLLNPNAIPPTTSPGPNPSGPPPMDTDGSIEK